MYFDLSAFDFSDQSSITSANFARTPASSQTSLGINEQEEEPSILIPSYSTPRDDLGGFDIPLERETSSVAGAASRTGQLPSVLDHESPPGFDDVVFDVDENGALRPMDDADLVRADEVGAGAPDYIMTGPRPGDRQGRESSGGIEDDQELHQHIGFADDDIPMFGDDEPIPQVAEVTELRQDDNEDAVGRQSTSSIQPNEETSETAEAPQRRARPAKSMKPDQRTELSNRDLNEWNQNYLANMRSAARFKELQGSRANAKRYAALWSVGQGIGRVAFAFGMDTTAHPLAVFSGQSLWRLLKNPIAPTGTKRAHSPSEEADGSDEEGRRVRARTSSQEGAARGAEGGDVMFVDDDGMIIQGEDFNLESEVGRNAPQSLQDHSSGMPWNISGSRQSSTQPLGSGVLARLSSSVGGLMGGVELGPPSALGRRGSRLTSASPLLGRGLSRFETQELLDPSRLTSNEDEFADLDQQLGAGFAADFELYGPSANVDTQTAAQSQWVTATLENEAYNFLTFVNNKMQEHVREEGNEDIDADAVHDSITFEELLPPSQNSRVVGAQAFLHVLALATKGLLEVYQEEPFEEIEMAIAGN